MAYGVSKALYYKNDPLDSRNFFNRVCAEYRSKSLFSNLGIRYRVGLWNGIDNYYTSEIQVAIDFLSFLVPFTSPNFI